MTTVSDIQQIYSIQEYYFLLKMYEEYKEQSTEDTLPGFMAWARERAGIELNS